MNDFFATIYENYLNIYNSDFDVIFQTLFDSSSYLSFGLIFIIVPLVFFFFFYFIWKYPYGKLLHWFIALLITFLVVALSTVGVANNEIFSSNNPELINLINNHETGYDQYAKALPLKYALWNSIFGAILGFIYSLILKQFSKIQIHLPF